MTAPATTVLVALTTTRRIRMLRWAESRLALGEDVVLVTGSAGPWAPLPEGVRVIELAPLEQQHWTTRWLFHYRVAVTRRLRAAVVLALRVVARVLRMGGRPTARLSQAARQAAGRQRTLSRRGGGARWREWSRSPSARHVRPWLLWRSLRPHLATLLPPEVSTVVWGDQQSWPIVWHLSRHFATAEVLGFNDLINADFGPAGAAARARRLS